MQAAGETALPEVLVSLRNVFVPVAEGRNLAMAGENRTSGTVWWVSGKVKSVINTDSLQLTFFQ